MSLGLTRRVDKSLHFLFAKGLETKSFLVALLLVSGFVLDWMKAYLVYCPQNVRLFTLPLCPETEKMLICLKAVCNVNFTNGTALISVQVNPFLLQCFFTVRRMQSNFFRHHFGLEWEKRKIVRKVHAKCILQTAPHNKHCLCFVFLL